ncbi:hypothetical protein JCM11641_005527 [Rhodosporidiobolus odoratus]
MVPRILMLPGYTQNAAIFSGRLGALRRALKDQAELVFVDPPHVVHVPTESAEDFKNKFDSDASSAPASDADTPRAWWFAEPSTGDGHYRKFRDFDATLRYLRDILEKQGPFDGVFGFSQGGAAAAILAALVENPTLDPIFAAPSSDSSVQWPPKPFKFAILSAGFFPLDPQTSAYFTSKPTTPTLHVLGKGDTIVGEDRSIPLTQAFADARVEWHDGGHHTPSKASWRRFFVDYIKAFSENGGGAEAAKTLPSPSGEGAATEGGQHTETMLHHSEVAQHNSAESLWVIVNGNAYDLTECKRPHSLPRSPQALTSAFSSAFFLAPEHPGGMKILLKYAGQDATEAYEPIHPPGTLEQYLPKEKHLGAVDLSGLKIKPKEDTQEEKERKQRMVNKPPLDECLSLYDFEAVAKSVLPIGAWGYYSSGADDEITMRENRSAFQRLWFRPRILRDVEKVDFSCTMLGQKSSLPIYITATALGKLGHPDGEKNLTWAGREQDIIQMIPTLASCSFDEIVDAAQPGQVQWMQLYVNKDREITKKIVEHAEKRGIKGLFITVDAPQLGRREKDMRQKFVDEGSNVQNKSGEKVDKNQGAARAISSFIDPGLSWKDIPWFKSITRMPIVLKGVQCWEDAVLAAEAGLAGVVLSNHGGRQLDFARSGIEILAETMSELRKRDLLKNGFEVYIDGGVRRAGDILKAYALGAKGVGIGRAFLYAYSAYGKDGVVKAIQILKDEMEMDMRLLGAPTLADVVPEMLDTSALGLRVVDTQPDYLMRANYEPLAGVGNGLGAQPRLISKETKASL